MYGTYLGDVIGSRFPRGGASRDFALFAQGCGITDDSVMTAAAAEAVMDSAKHRIAEGDETTFRSVLIQSLQRYARRYPGIAGGYGERFSRWLNTKDPLPFPSRSNGAALRAGLYGLCAVSVEEARQLARIGGSVTHSDEEALKGAEAVAAAVYLAYNSESRETIRAYLTENFYPLDFTVAEIAPSYRPSTACERTVPQALEVFLESESLEDALRSAVLLGGGDTMAAIAGTVAWNFYREQASMVCKAGGEAAQAALADFSRTEELKNSLFRYVPMDLVEVAEVFKAFCSVRHRAMKEKNTLLHILTPDEENE